MRLFAACSFGTIALIVSTFAKPKGHRCAGRDDPDIVNPDTECPDPDFKGDQDPDKYQGDIDGIDPKAMTDGNERNAVLAQSTRWKKSSDGNVYVPYDYNPTVGRIGKSAILAAIKDFNELTCIRFIPRASQRDYVHFTRGVGCSSALGRVGGKQFLSLGGGCENKGTAIHEMIHAIGFLHEQARPDRDSHIKVLWKNISPGRESQFEKGSTAHFTTQGLQYDYKSLMHYNNFAFSDNGLPTMESKDPKFSELGQRLGFTRLDIQKVNKLYSCDNGPATPGSTEGTTRRPIIITGTPKPTTTQNPGPINCEDKSGAEECLRVIADRPDMCNKVRTGPILCRKSCGFC